jgi:hypothetical protein
MLIKLERIHFDIQTNICELNNHTYKRIKFGNKITWQYDEQDKLYSSYSNVRNEQAIINLEAAFEKVYSNIMPEQYIELKINSMKKEGYVNEVKNKIFSKQLLNQNNTEYVIQTATLNKNENNFVYTYKK